MSKKWYHNAKTKEIDSYHDYGDITDFPRGTFLAYGDYLTTGIKSEAEAQQWAAKWAACPTCKAARSGQPGDACKFCKTTLE